MMSDKTSEKKPSTPAIEELRDERPDLNALAARLSPQQQSFVFHLLSGMSPSEAFRLEFGEIGDSAWIGANGQMMDVHVHRFKGALLRANPVTPGSAPDEAGWQAYQAWFDTVRKQLESAGENQ